MNLEPWTSRKLGNLSGIRAIVTGANTGLGFETARELAQRGASVVLACRSEQKGQEAVRRITNLHADAVVEFMPLDLASLESVHQFSQRFLAVDQPLKVLINNAGIMMPPFQTTADGFESQFGVNHLGHFALTGLLLPRLLATPNARVVNVSSLAHKAGNIDFDNLRGERGYRSNREYSQSKLANLLFTFELSRRLRANGLKDVRAVAAHPGISTTDLTRHSKLMTLFAPLVCQAPEMGALPTLYAATHMDAFSGDYIGPRGFMEFRGTPVKVKCSRRAQNQALAEKLWEKSEELTGVSFQFTTKAES